MINRNNKGITLIALVITIVVLLIIASISIIGGIEGAKTAAENKLLTELDMVQHAALQRYTKAQMTKEDVPGNTIEDINDVKEKVNDINNKISDGNKIYLKGRADEYKKLDKDALKELGITNTEDEYIVNYSTGEVINTTREITDSGKALYIYATEAKYADNGLVLYYDGINNTGNGHSSNITSWKDLSGNGNDGEISGGTWQDSSLKLDGSDDCIKTKDKVQMHKSKQLTIEIVDLNGELHNNENTGMLIESSNDWNYNDKGFGIDINEYVTNGLAFTIMEKDENTVSKKGYNIKSTTKEIIGTEGVNTYTIILNTEKEYNNYISIYKNGKLLHVDDVDNNSGLNLKKNISNLQLEDYIMYIGSRAGGSLFTKMDLGAIRIYAKALTEQEIESNYQLDQIRF